MVVSITEHEFKRALGRWPSGVTVVTAELDGLPHGMTASSFTSVSLHPALISVCLDLSARTLLAVQRSKAFAVNVLERSQAAVSARFASAGPESLKFDGEPVRGALGSPLLDGALVQLQCTVFAEFNAGDHVIVVGEVRHVNVRDGQPLLYYAGHYGQFSTP